MNQPAPTPVACSAPPVASPPAPLRQAARSSLAVSMIANALGQLGFIVSGFIIPRLINDHVGTITLGVWDLGWSMVAHLMLVGGGIMSAVSREVARFPATGDVQALRRVISSCFVLFSALGLVIIALTGGFVVVLPTIMDLPAELLPEARLVLTLLGVATGLRFCVHVFNGIVTGLQHYVLHNIIIAGCYLLGMFSGAALVLSGWGITALAATYLASEVLAGALKATAAARICPHWRIAWSDVHAPTLRHVFSFGGKTLLASGARVLMMQTSALLVGSFLGLEQLARFARCRSLVMLLDTLVSRIVSPFTPRASEADAARDEAAVQKALLQATEMSLFVVTPGVLALVLLGGPILELWMGPSFALGGLAAVLAVGQLGMLAQRGTLHVLIGLGRHGWPALLDLLGALLTLGLSVLMLGPLQMGLIGAALAIAIPLSVNNWLVLPWYAARITRMPLTRLLHAATRPLAALGAPALIFLVTRQLHDPQRPAWLLAGLALGLASHAALFLHFVMTPPRWRRLRERLGLRSAAHAGSSA